MLAFSPVYPVYQMCTLYIHLHNLINQPFHLCRAMLSGVSFWYGFPLYRIHTHALTWVAISLQALIWHFDMSHKILLFICSHLWNHLYITSHNDHTAKHLSLEICSLLLLIYWLHALSLNKWCIGYWARNMISIWEQHMTTVARSLHTYQILIK